MRRDFAAEWIQILITWPIAFAIGVAIIFGWRAWKVSQGTMKQYLAPLAGVMMIWGFAALVIAGYLTVGPLPMDDYPYRR